MSTQRLWQHSLVMGLLGVVLLTLPLSVAWAGPLQSGSGHVDYRPDEVVVKLDPAVGATIAAINATYGTTTLKTLSGSAGIYLLQTPPGADAANVADEMADDLRLLFAEPNFITEVPEANPRGRWAWGGPDATPFAEQYTVTTLNLVPAHAISRGQGAVVAILDTGVQLNHPALAASLTATGYDFVDEDAIPEDEFGGVDQNGQPHVDNLAGHGTHVAGIVHLTAPEAQLMPVRVLDVAGQGDIFTLAEAILYAINNGADVINLSLGMPERSDLLKGIIREATRQRAVVVAAAGNENSEAKQYPAADQCALAVTAVGPARTKSDFANLGSWIAVAAPGEGIYSTLPPDGYAWWSGTSMATPFVAGQAALIHSLAPSLTARDVTMLIGGTAQSLDGLNPAFAGRLGRGQIDIGGSLAQLQAGNLPTSGSALISGSCTE